MEEAMPSPRVEKVRAQKVNKAVRDLLLALGFDLNNQELRRTPARMTKLLVDELSRKPDPSKLFQVSKYPFSSMITMRNHLCFTRCPHHFEKVEMVISISYIPNGWIIGYSKLARIANYFSQGLMLQEEIADGIVDGLMAALKPKGVAVHIIGKHNCARARGVRSINAEMVTTTMRGCYLKEPETREEFFHSLKGG
jgi:GTP cyclohydrolase I